MEESEKYIGEGRLCDEEEVKRIANAEKIAALRKRCEEFMLGLVRDFGDIIIEDTVDISETERNEIKWDRYKKTAYVFKNLLVDFRLCFTAYKRD